MVLCSGCLVLSHPRGNQAHDYPQPAGGGVDPARLASVITDHRSPRGRPGVGVLRSADLHAPSQRVRNAFAADKFDVGIRECAICRPPLRCNSERADFRQMPRVSKMANTLAPPAVLIGFQDRPCLTNPPSPFCPYPSGGRNISKGSLKPEGARATTRVLRHFGFVSMNPRDDAVCPRKCVFATRGESPKAPIPHAGRQLPRVGHLEHDQTLQAVKEHCRPPPRVLVDICWSAICPPGLWLTRRV